MERLYTRNEIMRLLIEKNIIKRFNDSEKKGQYKYLYSFCKVSHL